MISVPPRGEGRNRCPPGEGFPSPQHGLVLHNSGVDSRLWCVAWRTRPSKCQRVVLPCLRSAEASPVLGEPHLSQHCKRTSARDQAGGRDGVSPVLSAMLHRRDSNERASARIELVAPISLFVLFRCLSKSRARCRALATVPAGHQLPAADTFFRFNVLIDCRFISKRNALRMPGRRVAFHPDHPGVSPLSGSILAPTSQTAWAPQIPNPPSRTSCGHRHKQAIGRPSQTVLECTDSSQDTNIRSTADEPSGSSRSAIHSQGDLRVAAWLRLSGDRGGAC